MKKGQELEIEITGYEFPNKPFGKYEDRKIYPQGNFLIGNKVRGIITKIRQKKVEMKNTILMKKAENEIDPSCNHFNICGGCTFQNLKYSDQVNLKSKLVYNILKKIVPYDFEYENTITSPKEYEYRNKMEFSFGNEKINGPLTLGMHKKGSFHDVITVSNCKLMNEDFRKILQMTVDYFKEKNIDFYHRLQHKGYLRNLVIRKGEKTGELGVNLITSSQKNFNLEEWKNNLFSLKLKGRLTSIIHTINDNLSDSVQSDSEFILHGSRDINEKIFGLNFKISPYSFFQTNSMGIELLYGKVLEYIKNINNNSKQTVVFDLFSGTGTIGQIISKEAKSVYGIEIIEEAVKKANETAKENNIKNAEFIHGDVFEKLDEFNVKNIFPDIIILDPPRAGIGEKTIEKLLKYNVKNIIYVSCNPKTFVLDLNILQMNGYKLIKVCPVDMFPQTPHLEIVTLLEKNVSNI